MVISEQSVLRKQKRHILFASFFMHATHQAGMPRRAKLWGKLEAIKSCKDSKFGGKKYEVKLVGVEKIIWVLAKDLSAGVVEKYNLDEPLPKNAKVHVNRGYVQTQKLNAQVMIVCLYVCSLVIAVLIYS